MKRIALALGLLALPAAAMAATNAAPHVASPAVVKVTMPGDLDYDYKPGPGRQLAQTYCLTCHSSGYVSMQPPMDAKHWLKTVVKMRKAYKAQYSEADATKIAAYLGAEYGPKTQESRR